MYVCTYSDSYILHALSKRVYTNHACVCACVCTYVHKYVCMYVLVLHRTKSFDIVSIPMYYCDPFDINIHCSNLSHIKFQFAL